MSGIFSAFSGRLGAPPERKTIGKGENLIFNVAVKDYPEEVTWVKVRTQQLNLESLLDKGTSVFIVGKHVVNKRAEDKGGGYWGPEVIAYDVQVISGFKSAEGAEGSEGEKGGRRTRAQAKNAEADIPF